jgi:hypothetical protein
MKFSKIIKLMGATSLLGVSLLSVSGVSAFSDIDGGTSSPNNITWNAYDPLSWNQMNAKDMPPSWLGSQMLDGSSGVEFPKGGDLIYVYTFLAIKTGFKQPGYIPSFANADLERLHAYANGLPHFGAEGIWGNGWHANLQSNGSQLQQGATLDGAKKAWSSGKLVVLQVKYPNYSEQTPYTHFLAIDSVESNGDIYIFDSVNPNRKFSDSYSAHDIVGMITLESDKAKSGDLPKLWQKRGFKDLNDPNGRPYDGADGGGGALPPSKITPAEETKLPSAEKDDQSLGKYKSVDDSPNTIEKGSKVKNKKKEESGSRFNFWNILAAVLGVGIPVGGIFLWKRLRK